MPKSRNIKKNGLGKPVASFEVRRLEILSPQGKVLGKLPKLSNDQIKQIYESMVLARIFDGIALKLQREGRMLTYASIHGQEAQVVVALAMQKDDWLFPSFREDGVQIARGMPLDLLYQYWMGDERGQKIPEDLNNFTISIPVGSQIPHAVGAAYAMKIKKQNDKKTPASVVFFGDGATSEGDFHEGMNFAGALKVPCVFICQNNKWAISMPVSKQTASQTIAQKAIAYGLEGVQVDGNDVFAVYEAAKYALEKARSGSGPTFIEMDTYRMSDHTTSDDASKYRPKTELENWKKRDPITRMQKFMLSKGLWSAVYEKQLLERLNKKVADAVAKAEIAGQPLVADMFDYTYAELPESLKEQKEWIDNNENKK
ncbi:MAG: pyruvate dehydrogenase (acetyl-transferring) E1 component subunit alpha [Candidatus Aenigmarchaeota archaeon]|nr:pyruvate dehydrogenase (acetyl-transferring) E1 component subunit alpha [Candidatus Aenigmarchaeota archaeon]